MTVCPGSLVESVATTAAPSWCASITSLTGNRWGAVGAAGLVSGAPVMRDNEVVGSLLLGEKLELPGAAARRCQMPRRPTQRLDDPHGRPARRRLQDPYAGARQPRSADPIGFNVRSFDAHRAEQVRCEELARGFPRAHENAHGYLRTPRSEGASRKVSSRRPVSVCTDSRSVSIACRKLRSER